MSRHRHPDIFPRDFGKKLAVNHIAFETDLLIFDGWRSAPDIGVGRELPGSRSLSQGRSNFLRVQMNLGFGLRKTRLSIWRCRSVAKIRPR